jgi:hypothetical protein
MNQKATAFCVAAAFGCIASLGAQTPTPTTSGQSNTMHSTPAHDVTVTGCLAKGADGRFVLNNAKMDDQMSSSTTAEGTTAGTTAGTPASKTTTPAATTWLLGGGNDLDKHLGHKISVTGKTSWDASMSPSTASGTSTTGTPTTAGTTGSAATSGEQRTSTDSDSKGANQPRLDVQSIKMIASTCS